LVLVADNPRKQYLFSTDERVELLKQALEENDALSGIEIFGTKMLTVDFAKKEKVNMIARSVRNVADWEYEYAMADANRKLWPAVETLFIMADPKFGFISSSLVREVAAFGGNTSEFVPSNVSEALQKKARQKTGARKG